MIPRLLHVPNRYRSNKHIMLPWKVRDRSKEGLVQRCSIHLRFNCSTQPKENTRDSGKRETAGPGAQKNFDPEHPLAGDSKGRTALRSFYIQYSLCRVPPPSHYVFRTHTTLFFQQFFNPKGKFLLETVFKGAILMT